MTEPPRLDHSAAAGPLELRYALLINPLYPKDPNASFGKHVLTPTLALTSFAGTTPGHWRLQYWLECSTFHILTPYPATPLFRQMEAEGRLLHRDWSLYDTSHAVFHPKHMTPEELEQGYAWIYARLFSPASIWRRRPEDWRAVAPYLAMSYLYKRSNRFWHLLIKHDLVNGVWRPLVELTRLRHLQFRRRLPEHAPHNHAAGNVVTAGV